MHICSDIDIDPKSSCRSDIWYTLLTILLVLLPNELLVFIFNTRPQGVTSSFFSLQ